MSTIYRSNDSEEFNTLNHERLRDNYFVYYTMIQAMKAAKAGIIQVHDAYNVVGHSGNEVVCMHFSGNYFVVSHKWDELIIEKLIQEIDFRLCKCYHFLGQKQLLFEILKRKDVKYQIFKDRYIYECIKVNSEPKGIVGKTELATLRDLNELVVMGVDNNKEEYKGKGSATKEKMRKSLISGIESDSLYLLRDNGKICSMVQVINDMDDEPMIGNLFTKKEMRNKGYAFSLLYNATKELLNDLDYNKCGLLADATNPASNKVFRNVGYEPVFEWLDVIIE